MTPKDPHGILRRLHQAAYERRIAHGVGLWDRFPLGIAVRIANAGVEIQDIDFSLLGDPIVMDQNGDLLLCTRLEIRPFQESDGNWNDT